MANNCRICGGTGVTASFNPGEGRPSFEKCTACGSGIPPEDLEEGERKPDMSPKRNGSLPPIVKKLTHGFDAWIVGGAADPSNDSPRDYDIQVPYSSWGLACFLIPSDAKVNSFGGFRFRDEDGSMIDVWPGELGWIMQRPGCKWAWQPKSGIFLTRVNV